MDIRDVTDVTIGYRERMRRVALFDPLFELGRKQTKDEHGNPIDAKGLGMLTLLYFFEQKVMRNTKVGTKEVGVFLCSATKGAYRLSNEQWHDQSAQIIKLFRPATGKKREYWFEDWETEETDKIEYSILRANGYDAKENVQYYTLDEDGLELVFATKEFYSEFQLSINQLMLRKQLEKGEFQSALRQINEMFIDVEALEERIYRLRHEIQRSIVSEETFERYEQLIGDVHARLERENEEFDELRQFVIEARERMYEQDHQRKEPKTYGLILDIVKNLEHVHYSHSDLLNQILELKTQTLRAAQEALYHTGIDAFNFNQEIVLRLTSTPLPLDVMKGMVHPFLTILQTKTWSPFTIFSEQYTRENRESHDEKGFMQVDVGGDDIRNDRLRRWYGELMGRLIEALEEGEIKLSSFIALLQDKGETDILHKRFFYDFWMILHQRSPLRKEGAQTDTYIPYLFDEALIVLGERTLIVQEERSVLQVTKRYSIQEMTVKIKEETIDAI